MIKLKAPAKINLRLEVLGELPNRYHLLRMFNVTVDLCDELEIDFRGRGINVETDDETIPSGEDNLAWRAADYFIRKYRVGSGAAIRIRKRIPVGGGLGGGSSDAAGVLRAFCRRFRVSRLDLEEIAYEIGADVPYLLSCGPAWVEGIGEKVERVSGFPRMFYLLAKPSFSVSTREVYRLLGPSPNLTIEPKEVILSRLARDGWKQFCANHLEKVVFARHQELEQIKSELSRSGARTSLMSGSGSTLVGIFSDFARAERAAGALRKKRPGLWARVVRQYKPRATRG